MTNSEISEKFRKAGIKNHRLLNKPRPKWTNEDFKEMSILIDGKRFQKYTYIKKEKKSIIRKIDFEKYDSVKHAAYSNNMKPSQMYYLLRKGIDFKFSE
jgi:hypothetical protein